MIYTTIPYKRQICKYSDKRYVYRDNRLKVIRKKIIKIPPDYTDLLGFLGASRTDDNKGILMTKHDNYERQQIFEDNWGEMERCDKVICPIWQFDSLDSVRKLFGSLIKDCGDDIKKVEVWQLSQNAASEEVTKELKEKIASGLKPIENWRCYLKQDKMPWDLHKKQIDGKYYLLDGKVYAVLNKDRRHIKAFPMEKAYMYLEYDDEGNLIGTSGDFFSNLKYGTILDRYDEDFIKSQKKMNDLLTKGQLYDPNGDLQRSASDRMAADYQWLIERFEELCGQYNDSIKKLREKQEDSLSEMVDIGKKLKSMKDVLGLDK